MPATDPETIEREHETREARRRAAWAFGVGMIVFALIAARLSSKAFHQFDEARAARREQGAEAAGASEVAVKAAYDEAINAGAAAAMFGLVGAIALVASPRIGARKQREREEP